MSTAAADAVDVVDLQTLPARTAHAWPARSKMARSTAAGKRVRDPLARSTEWGKRVLASLVCSTAAGKRVRDPLARSTEWGKRVLASLVCSTAAGKGVRNPLVRVRPGLLTPGAEAGCCRSISTVAAAGVVSHSFCPATGWLSESELLSAFSVTDVLAPSLSLSGDFLGGCLLEVAER
jgi:hypothetical protein